MKNLKDAIRKEYQKRIAKTVASIGIATEDHKIPQDALNWFVRWTLDKRIPYKGTFEEQKEKAIAQYKKRLNAQLEKQIKEIEEIEKAPDFTGELIITVEWKDSRMWRSNPRAYTNYGFKGDSIGGCGYDKLSTATAQALNSDKRILKLMYIAKNKLLAKKHYNPDGSLMSDNDIHRKFLGYGSGYNILPKFEGGVGVSCHQRIIEGLGLVWKNITSTDSTDVYLITTKGD